jgi:hypothetical protein
VIWLSNVTGAPTDGKKSQRIESGQSMEDLKSRKKAEMENKEE